MERWHDRVAVVTGASSGIGAAVARQLVSAGVIVVGLARRVDRMEVMKEQLPPELQGRLHAIHCDVGDLDSVTAAFDWIEEQLGGCDILVNNAGCLNPGQLLTLELEQLQQVLNVNLMGVVICTRRAFRSMQQREVDGHVVLINSLTGRNIINPPGDELQVLNMYPLTKHGVTALLEVLRQELRGFKTKIKVTLFLPTFRPTTVALGRWVHRLNESNGNPLNGQPASPSSSTNGRHKVSKPGIFLLLHSGGQKVLICLP